MSILSAIVIGAISDPNLAYLAIGIVAREAVRGGLWLLKTGFAVARVQVAAGRVPHVTPAMLDEFRADLLTEIAKSLPGPNTVVSVAAVEVAAVPAPVPAQPPVEKPPAIPVYNQD